MCIASFREHGHARLGLGNLRYAFALSDALFQLNCSTSHHQGTALLLLTQHTFGLSQHVIAWCEEADGAGDMGGVHSPALFQRRKLSRDHRQLVYLING